MAKNTIQLAIKNIPLTIKLDGLSEKEITDLALEVENKMISLQQDGVIDTLKQALQTALFFAKQEYLAQQKQLLQNKETQERTDKLIARLRQSLEEKND